jgi:hypothetical protein
VRIYLACTVRGDRGAVAALRSLVAALERRGHTILTAHLLEDGVDTAEAALTERAVYDRDIAWLESCSDRTSQRVLLLYRGDRLNQISRLIPGNSHPRCTVLKYENPVDLVDRVLGSL